jgi:hypothetical protein
LEVIGIKLQWGGEKLHEELHNLYSFTNIFRMMKSRRLTEHIACMGERSAHRNFVGKHEGVY